jgi:hypothetical protein
VRPRLTAGRAVVNRARFAVSAIRLPSLARNAPLRIAGSSKDLPHPTGLREGAALPPLARLLTA